MKPLQHVTSIQQSPSRTSVGPLSLSISLSLLSPRSSLSLSLYSLSPLSLFFLARLLTQFFALVLQHVSPLFSLLCTHACACIDAVRPTANHAKQVQFPRGAFVCTRTKQDIFLCQDGRDTQQGFRYLSLKGSTIPIGGNYFVRGVESG